MGPKEDEYLQSQLSSTIGRNDPNKVLCYPHKCDIDEVWAKQQNKKDSLDSYYAQQRKLDEKQFESVTFEDNAIVCDIDDSDYEEEGTENPKKRKFKKVANSDDHLPLEYRHVRSSERKVLDKFYLAAGDLIGEGLSPREALLAIEIVANRCFDRKFKQLDDCDKKYYDQNTLPSIKMVRAMTERIEAQGLASEASEIITRKTSSVTITHASDSTTKKAVGKFHVSGIHINQQKPLPLPVVPVAGESREDIAEQAALGFHILAAACNPPIEPAMLYSKVDLHMTDSVSHNKFLYEDVPKLFDLDHTVGQIFCATHTGLGLCRSLNKNIHIIEQSVGISNVLDGFVVQIEFESKNGSIVGQFVDCITRLVGIELKHKPWNRGEEFKRFCTEQDVCYEMFLYKDERFGCYPKACAVCIYSKEVLQNFLMTNTNIDNRLACLVRDIIDHEYALLSMTVVAVFGIQLIEPFHAVTINKKSTHLSLQIFFKDLYSKMKTPITEVFFNMDTAWFPGISSELFENVKKRYRSHVVESVKEYIHNHLQEAVKLANFFLPDLIETLARQRKYYGLSDDFEAEFPVENLSDHAAVNSPVNNMSMESFCGMVGHRTAKNRNLEATSRSIIIKGTTELRKKFGEDFKGYRQAAIRVKEVKMEWKIKQDELAGQKIEIKASQNLKVEARILHQLEYLKKNGGPFTSCLEINNYLTNKDIPENMKKKRMKMEVQYARDSSLTLPRTNQVFRIRKRIHKEDKLRDLTPEEFGENLKMLITKKLSSLDKKISIESFVSAMESL